jgi:trehalose-phosphatase
MRDLREHWEELASRAGEAGRVCVLADYDGTLVPLVDRPELAVLPDATRRVLRDLEANPRIILGVVSGRSLENISALVGLPGLWYVGNHGFEIRTPGGREMRFYEEDDLRFLAAVTDELAAETADIPGAVIERKGPIVALHFRLVAEDRVPDAERAFLRVADRHHRRIMVGRGSRVFEARMRGNCNKGTALRIIRRELRLGTLLLYFGDDLTDRDAFRALHGVGLSVQVGPDDAALADYSLPDPAAVVATLRRLDGILTEKRATRRRRS